MSMLRRLLYPAIALTTLSMTACGGSAERPLPNGPTPSPAVVTANAYILPNAAALNDFAFGDEPVVVRKNERLRWINADTVTHNVVADSPDATDFLRTDDLRAGGDQSFVMNRVGTTRIHCSIHPNMTGTLIVR
jgi:plastocyanin